MNPLLVATLVQAGIQAGGSLLQRGQKVRKPREELDYWQRIAQEGMYSPQARTSLLNTAGQQTGNVAQQQTADIRGNLAYSGMGNSIAGVRALSAPGNQRMGLMGQYGRDLTAQNEMSKVGAAGNYASLMGGYQQAKQDVNTSNWNQRLGGLMNAGSMAAQGYAASKNTGFQFPENFGQMPMQDAYKWAADYGYNWTDIEPIWQQAMADYYDQLNPGGGSLMNPVQYQGWR